MGCTLNISTGDRNGSPYEFTVRGSASYLTRFSSAAQAGVLACLPADSLSRCVFGLTMSAEVSVHFHARPFGLSGSSRAGGKAVR